MNKNGLQKCGPFSFGASPSRNGRCFDPAQHGTIRELPWAEHKAEENWQKNNHPAHVVDVVAHFTNLNVAQQRRDIQLAYLELAGDSA